MSNADEILRLINVLRADEGDSVTIFCDNPDFNGQPNCAIECCGDWTGWLHKRFAADTLLDVLSMAMVEKNLPSPREVIATSNGHHWIKRFNLVCCRDCGFARRADDQNQPCKGAVGVGIRRDLLPDSVPDRELFWLVERIGQGQYVKDRSEMPGLTPDPWRAARFATEREAHDFWLRLATLRDECKPVEHMFINNGDSTS